MTDEISAPWLVWEEPSLTNAPVYALTWTCMPTNSRKELWSSPKLWVHMWPTVQGFRLSMERGSIKVIWDHWDPGCPLIWRRRLHVPFTKDATGISCMFLTCFSLDGRTTCETWWAGWMPKTAPTWTMDYNASRRPFQGTWLGGNRERARGILPNFLRNSVGSNQEDQQFCPVARLQDHGGGELLHCLLDQQPPACAKDGSSRTCGASSRR